jgi:hypothetical protein
VYFHTFNFSYLWDAISYQNYSISYLLMIFSYHRNCNFTPTAIGFTPGTNLFIPKLNNSYPWMEIHTKTNLRFKQSTQMAHTPTSKLELGSIVRKQFCIALHASRCLNKHLTGAPSSYTPLLVLGPAPTSGPFLIPACTNLQFAKPG